MLSYLLLIALTILSFQPAFAQVGPHITVPEYNATVTPGDHITIEYTYQNMGTGNYSIDVALWQDASATQLLQNVTTDHKIPGGNSTGFQLNFTYTGTYDWNVPGGLSVKRTFDNGTEIEEAPQLIYLTVTCDADTYFYDDLRLRSRPIMLHYNAAGIHLPNVLLLALSTVSAALVFLFV
ncbi:hypothetical protein LRAMOSA02838 [Lichtheimia ramosa]|uniref:CARDB domain-containing protein n=1 Tax=Lichtheimia ramosa TaxID=688394 RepID=A0A077WRB5_9FUNG|nr:hypothetical protein LRAMOSA02838 [Lichtheimia ramosa]